MLTGLSEHLRTISEQRLNWRRDKVKELSVKGYTQRKIADTLRISLALVNEDLQHLRLKAKENISKYLEEYLPAEYENCLDGLNDILQEAWAISTGAESNTDKRERMQALSLAKECYAMKLDLLSSATIVDRAVKFVNRNRGLIQENGKVAMDSNNNNDSAEPVENT